MAPCNVDRSFPCRALPDPELDLEGWGAAAMPAALRLVRADLTADLVGLATRDVGPVRPTSGARVPVVSFGA